MADNQNITFKYSREILFDYALGILGPPISKEIESDIKSSEELASIVDGIRILIGSGYDDFESFEQQLELSSLRVTDQVKPMQSGHTRHRYLTIMYKAAAVVLILLIPFSVAYYLKSTSYGSLLQQEIHEHYTSPIVVRGDYDKQLWADAAVAYQGKDFPLAIKLLSEYLTINQKDTQALFYIGISHLYSGQPEKAIDHLDDVLLSESRLKPQAKWFKALALLEAGSQAEGQALLELIAEDPSAFKCNAAKKLLDSIN